MSRWPLIRHIRWWYLTWQCNRRWLHVGRYSWLLTNVWDEAYLDAVWKGNA